MFSFFTEKRLKENIRPTPEIKFKKFQFLNRDILYYQSEVTIFESVKFQMTHSPGRLYMGYHL